MDYLKRDEELLQNIKRNLPELKELLAGVENHWGYEDGVYRFYSGSFKVYRLQDYTVRIVADMRKLDPRDPSDIKSYGKFHDHFEQIIAAGTGKVFSLDHNHLWAAHTRPIVEAFLHAKYMLEMIVKAGETLEAAPAVAASGWATIRMMYLPKHYW